MEKVFIILILTICISYTVKKIDDIVIIVKCYSVSAALLVIALMISGQLFTAGRLGSELSSNANAFTNKMLFPCVASVWLFTTEKKKKLVYIICFVLILLAIGLSGGRKIVIAVGVSVVYLYWSNANNNVYKKLRNIIIVSVMIFAALYAMRNVPVLYNSIGVRFFNRNIHDINSDKTRLLYITSGLQNWLKKPFFGHGIDSFKFYSLSNFGTQQYAHNNYIELLYDYGIAGFMLYYYFVVYCVYNLSKLSQNNRMKILGFAIIISLLIFDMGGISYFTNINQIMILLVYLMSCRKENDSI